MWWWVMIITFYDFCCIRCVGHCMAPSACVSYIFFDIYFNNWYFWANCWYCCATVAIMADVVSTCVYVTCLMCVRWRCMCSQLLYKESSGGHGKLMTNSSRKSKNPKLVPCFPLHALLVALNQSTIDYFSLDVEGFELEVRPTNSEVI